MQGYVIREICDMIMEKHGRYLSELGYGKIRSEGRTAVSFVYQDQSAVEESQSDGPRKDCLTHYMLYVGLALVG